MGHPWCFGYSTEETHRWFPLFPHYYQPCPHRKVCALLPNQDKPVCDDAQEYVCELAPFFEVWGLCVKTAAKEKCEKARQE
jgi:hypothetical protein